VSPAGATTREPGPVYTVAFMTGLTAIFVTAVAATHLASREAIRLNESAFVKRAVLGAGGQAVADDPRTVEAAFGRAFEEVEPEGGGTAYYRQLGRAGKLEGYVIIERGPGLWGVIEAAVGFSADGRVITGVDFTRQNETPGLGARISEEWFRKQFRDKRPPLVAMKPEGEPSAENEFDAVTGATITSTAVMKIVNRASERARGIASGKED